MTSLYISHLITCYDLIVGKQYVHCPPLHVFSYSIVSVCPVLPPLKVAPATFGIHSTWNLRQREIMEVEPGAVSSLDDRFYWSSGLSWTKTILCGIRGGIRWGVGCLEQDLVLTLEVFIVLKIQTMCAACNSYTIGKNTSRYLRI